MQWRLCDGIAVVRQAHESRRMQRRFMTDCVSCFGVSCVPARLEAEEGRWRLVW